MQVPLSPLAPHPKVDSLRPAYEALKHTYETSARQDLSAEQQADLSQFEADVKKLAELQPQLRLDPTAPLDMFADAVEVKQQSDSLQGRIHEVLERHRKFPSNLYFYGKPGELMTTGLAWHNERLSPELEDLGYNRAAYQLTYDAQNRDMEVQAHLQRADGTPDLHYLQYRVALGAPDHWRGAELTLGSSEGYHQLKATPLARASEDLYVSDDSQMSRWTRTEQAFVAQAMQDLGVGWLAPTLCPHCK
jgi:hypothetical protein